LGHFRSFHDRIHRNCGSPGALIQRAEATTVPILFASKSRFVPSVRSWFYECDRGKTTILDLRTSHLIQKALNKFLVRQLMSPAMME
jgi:hypothetical protein